MSSRFLTRALTALVPFATGCQLWVGEYVADQEDPADVSELCDVERSLFRVELDLDSDDRLGTIAEYYAAANPELVRRFDAVAEAYAESASMRAATYVMGEAGAGKSFMMRRLVDAFPREQKCELALAEVLAAPSDLHPTKRLPDLTTISESLTLNSLPGFVDPGAFNLPKFLEEQGCFVDDHVKPLLVLDGLDEIHTSSAHALVREVEQFLLAGGDDFVHVILSGRPEGFAPWFSDPMRGDATNKVVELLRLRTPLYVTAGDVALRLREYLEFSKQLAEVEANDALDDYTDSVLEALDAYPFLRYSLSNLAVGNVVLQHTAPGMDESESSLKAKIFEDLIARNADTHRRPGTGTRYDAPYLGALEKIAATYVNVNARGEFSVSPKDSVVLESLTGEALGELSVIATLERSGLAYLASPTSTTKRFRFSPFWVHGYLAERYNARNTPKYQYRGCD